MERINGLLAERCLLKRAAYEAIGVSASTFSTWSAMNGSSIPSEYIVPLAKLFGISWEELLTGEASAPVSDNEKRLLQIFRDLDWEAQTVVLAKAVEEKRLQVPAES